MSETIIVALITMATGVLGAGVGAFVSIKTMQKESERRFREEKKACYSQLISAYTSLRTEVCANSPPMDAPISAKEKELFAQFEIAHTNALLICNKYSVEPISNLYNEVSSFCVNRAVQPSLHSAYVSALTMMRQELAASGKQTKKRVTPKKGLNQQNHNI